MKPLPCLDWREPWFAPWAEPGKPALDALAAGCTVPVALTRNAPGIRFVEAGCLPEGRPYESFVRDTGTVPSRDNLHDFFKGIAWHLFPQTKRHLNHLQADAIARNGIAGRRGPLRDAITLFDENGAVFSAPPALLDALRMRDWHALFVTHRDVWAQARLWLFGHALVEKLVTPRKDITAHVLCAPQGLHEPAQVDAWMCGELDAGTLERKPFSPLPILGVPGWWAPNEAPDFYCDATVFRPHRAMVKPRA